MFTINTLDIVSEEKDLVDHRSNDHIHNRPKGTERRFADDLDDRDWHVTYLKNVDFDVESNCKEENFTEKVNKYRKSLKQDGSLVEYVSADALLVSDADLHENKCVSNNQSKINTKSRKKKIGKKNDTDTAVNKSNKSEAINTATTADANSLKQKSNDQNATAEKSRRTSEYQFSSDEYYDDIENDIDDDFCPDFVEVINLDMDQLRNYDVECELTLEWRSLE
ncbi:uncharacterized protein [Epargyreus clarus]|uniref:uncharacterized protein n=1 Tax=Epargyreus clarus TaxID=520877 RepID=UPI003C2B9C8A